MSDVGLHLGSERICVAVVLTRTQVVTRPSLVGDTRALSLIASAPCLSFCFRSRSTSSAAAQLARCGRRLSSHLQDPFVATEVSVHRRRTVAAVCCEAVYYARDLIVPDFQQERPARAKPLGCSLEDSADDRRPVRPTIECGFRLPAPHLVRQRGQGAPRDVGWVAHHQPRSVPEAGPRGRRPRAARRDRLRVPTPVALP